MDDYFTVLNQQNLTFVKGIANGINSILNKICKKSLPFLAKKVLIIFILKVFLRQSIKK